MEHPESVRVLIVEESRRIHCEWMGGATGVCGAHLINLICQVSLIFWNPRFSLFLVCYHNLVTEFLKFSPW